MAAAAGGITTILDQPLSNPSTVTAERLEKKIADLSKESVVDFALWGGLVPGYVDELGGMMSLGAHAFKSFMCRCSNYPMTPDGCFYGDAPSR
jgi:allantoinase